MKDCSCIICLLFVSSSSPNTLYCRKHVCMLNIWLWLYWTDINLHRRKPRENNKVMALNHKDIVLVKENLCFQHSTNWLGGSSWTWGELQCMSGLTLSAYLIDIERFKLVRTMYFNDTLWGPSSLPMILDNSETPWVIKLSLCGQALSERPSLHPCSGDCKWWGWGRQRQRCRKGQLLVPLWVLPGPRPHVHDYDWPIEHSDMGSRRGEILESPLGWTDS